jgi:coenzyme F420-reducing hydrogenase beta subunit
MSGNAPTVLHKAGLRDWPRDLVGKYVGPYQDVYFSHATDPALRATAASGGSVSALLIHLLETGQIQGALVVKTVVEDGKARPSFSIASTRSEIVGAQGSKYASVNFSSDALPLLREFQGSVAIVALPCDSFALHRVRRLEPELDRKVKLVITLLCGHNSEPVLTDLVVARLGAGHGKLTHFRWRSGHWRGQMSAAFEDGTTIVAPFSRFSVYRNLYFFAQPKCHHCFDHFGYYGDISAGDIWSLKAKKEKIKQTGLIVRTKTGMSAVQSATDAGELSARSETIDDILNGQSRTMPFHYNVSARARLAPLFNVRIRDRVHEKVRWLDYPVAFICLLNERVSRTSWGRAVIGRMPRPILQAYVYFFKALELL